MQIGVHGIFLVSAVLAIVTSALFIREKWFAGNKSDFYGPYRGVPSRLYPGRLPSGIGMTIEGAPDIPVILRRETLPPAVYLARARLARMGFGR